MQEDRQSSQSAKMAASIMEEVKYKVLLVEDNKLDQMAFTRFVETKKLPYDCTVAGSVSQALGMLDCEQFDVIVSDYSLGDGTALDVLNSAKNTPLIVVTATGSEDAAINTWKAGAYDYLTKDFDLNHLEAIPKTIENAIKSKRMEQAHDERHKSLGAIFDAAPVGMLLADENMTITHVNDSVRQTLHKDYPQIIDQRIGDVFGCIHSTDNEKKCGHFSACSECLLQKTIKDVLDSEQSADNIEEYPTLGIDRPEIMLWVRISAESVTIDGRRHVVIAVDDLAERKEVERKLQSVEDSCPCCP
ncbi:MAG: response regulator [Planctomycetota bacterium]|jgi:DNA-binding response OmpR family regulator